MIGQSLLNTNEKATMSILQNILELNKAQIHRHSNLMIYVWNIKYK